MFTQKTSKMSKRRHYDLSQFGLTEIPSDFDTSMDYGDNVDSDIEAELAAIAGNVTTPKFESNTKPQFLPSDQLDKMITESLRDISDDDDEIELENEEELLGELQAITGTAEEHPEADDPQDIEAVSEKSSLYLPTTTTDVIGILTERIKTYKNAEANAKAVGDAAKVRRFARGLKTLQDLLKQANTGKPINDDDIPPEIGKKSAAPPLINDSRNIDDIKNPSCVTPVPPVPAVNSEKQHSTSEQTIEVNNPMILQMRSRQKEYRAAALESKRNGDKSRALQFLKVVKQFDIVIKMCEDGEEVDFSDMPPKPDEFLEFLSKLQQQADKQIEGPSATTDTEMPSKASDSLPAVTVTNILDALLKRLEKYKSVEAAAKAEGNASKARRFGRIVKQYEDAIKLFKAGRPVPYEELPIPPGFEPLRVAETSSQISTSTPNGPSPSNSKPTFSDIEAPASTPNQPKSKSPTASSNQELTTRISGNQQKNNLAEEQMKLLLQRQKEFKIAAVEAKKAGEIEQAKEYLKIYKGFDALLNAASSGLPVDMSTLPVPPTERENLESSFAIVTSDDCDPNDDISDIGVRMEEQLAKQLMMCKNTRDHHKAMGDVAGMNRFENLALTVQKDLDLVRYSKRKNHPLPQFHYEKRSFNIVHCNTDLTDKELEIVIVRGINYNVSNPKDVDTYVKLEFPLLSDETFKSKTNVIKNTDNPEYNDHFRIDIQRSNRQFQRIFKRHSVKFEVYSRGGFLRSDTLIGTANVKLQPLETKCDIHNTYDLMEGRKHVGGKLEIKVRIRNPILAKQIEHINEKWLILDA